MTQDEKDKLAHETLLREIHNIDNIAEMHARTVILIIVALFAFVSQIHSAVGIYIAASVGMAVSFEMLLKVWRHRTIFRTCHDKLTQLEGNIEIDAIRPLPKPHRKLCSFDGFTILIWLAIFFIVVWGAVFGVTGAGHLPN